MIKSKQDKIILEIDKLISEFKYNRWSRVGEGTIMDAINHLRKIKKLIRGRY